MVGKLTNDAVTVVVCSGHLNVPKEGTAGGYGAPLTQAYVSVSQSGAGYGAPLTQAYVSGSQSGAEYVAPHEVQRQAEAQARAMDYNVVGAGGTVVYAVPLGGDEPEYVVGWLFSSFLYAVWWLCLLRTCPAVSVTALSPDASLVPRSPAASCS